jgi:hypothetical protein
MEKSFDPSLSWPHVLYLAGATILGYFVRKGQGWVVLWLNRNKPAAEIHLNEAQADKTRAEARKLNAEADVEFSAIVERLHARIDQMQEAHARAQQATAEIRAERDEYKLRNDLQAIELKQRDADIKKYLAMLEINHIKPSDYDKPKE